MGGGDWSHHHRLSDDNLLQCDYRVGRDLPGVLLLQSPALEGRHENILLRHGAPVLQGIVRCECNELARVWGERLCVGGDSPRAYKGRVERWESRVRHGDCPLHLHRRSDHQGQHAPWQHGRPQSLPGGRCEEARRVRDVGEGGNANLLFHGRGDGSHNYLRLPRRS